MKTLIKANYHTHTFLCKHALGDVEDYVKKAISLGYHTIAITDHGPFPKFLQKKLNSRRMSIEQYTEVYLDMIERSKKLHEKEIKVLSGIEIEYLSELEPFYPRFIEELDIMVLGQHYIKVNGECKSIYFPLTEDEINIYADTVVEAMSTGYFKILAHPEIFSWRLKEWDEICIKASKKIIDAAIKYNVILECNANGVRNSFYQRKEYYKDGLINFPYPRREFWQMVKEAGEKAMINDDAHAPNRMHDDYTVFLYDEAKKMGLELVDCIDGINN